MKKIILIILLSIFYLFGNNGEKIYEAKCASCHQLYIPVNKLMKNFMETNNTLLNLKAPSLNQIVYRLKTQIGDSKGDKEIHQMEIISFLSEYLMEPDLDKSVCLPEIIKYFDIMPSMKGKLTENELEEVSNFLYNYDSKKYGENKIKYLSYKKALNLAKNEDKILMLKITSKFCPFCKKMDREILTDKQVVESFNKDFIAVKLDINKDKFPLNLYSKKYPTPTFIFLTKKEEIMIKVKGFQSKKKFLHLLKVILDNKRKK